MGYLNYSVQGSPRFFHIGSLAMLYLLCTGLSACVLALLQMHAVRTPYMGARPHHSAQAKMDMQPGAEAGPSSHSGTRVEPEAGAGVVESCCLAVAMLVLVLAAASFLVQRRAFKLTFSEEGGKYHHKHKVNLWFDRCT